MFLIVRHEPDGKRLMMLPRFLEGRIDDLPTNAIGCGLKFIPEPATVSNGRVWKNRWGGNLGLFRRWAFFRPTETLIQWLAVEPLKSCDTDSGIDQYLINRLGSHNYQFRLRRGANKKRDYERDKQ